MSEEIDNTVKQLETYWSDWLKLKMDHGDIHLFAGTYGLYDTLTKYNITLITANGRDLTIAVGVQETHTEVARNEHRIHDDILSFNLDMEEKLRENNHKPYWGNSDIDELLRLLFVEAEELSFAVNNESNENIIKEAADVANFAMMIATVCRNKIKKEGIIALAEIPQSIPETYKKG